MPTKISKCTSKGQITLPKEFRDQFDTDSFIIDFDKKTLSIKPVNIADIDEEIIFDAKRDNAGKGFSIDQMLKLLQHG